MLSCDEPDVPEWENPTGALWSPHHEQLVGTPNAGSTNDSLIPITKKDLDAEEQRRKKSRWDLRGFGFR